MHMRVLLSEDFNKSRQLKLYVAMREEKQRSPDRLDWDYRAADALELAARCHLARYVARRSNWQACFVVLPTRGD
jgi:hypothetical protein